MSERRSPETEPLVDVELLVDDLRERVERERAAGLYADDVASLELEPVPEEPAPAPTSPPPARAEEPQVRYRPEVGYSSRRVVGPLLTSAKRLVYRVFRYPLDDLARQTSDAVERLAQQQQASDWRAEELVAAERTQRASATEAVIGRVDTLVNQLELADRMIAQAEAQAREAVERDVQSLAIRLAEVEAMQERLQLPSRLARLERLAKAATPQPAPAPAASSTANQPAPAFDYMTFENRFRPERTVEERHSGYLELLRGRRRVVDLGCGRGELLALLRDAGVSAYGVEVDPDVVAVCREKGLEVVQEDAVGHLETLEHGAVDAIVASHLIEHLTPDLLSRLITASAEKLADEGILVLETPNPESLLAGSINFHRDPTHVRPVHPDTLSFLCESAGFREVEIRRLAPVPADERLPQRSPDEHLSAVVEQLNELIYGYQDYALIARL